MEIIEEVQNTQLYRFSYLFKYENRDWPYRRDVYAYTREEADRKAGEDWSTRGAVSHEFQYMSKAGKDLHEVEAGDPVLYRDYIGKLFVASVERTTQRYIYLQGYQYRFRKDGSEVGEYAKRSIRRYDEREYQDYWKGVADKKRLNNVKRIDWLHIEDELFNEVYAFLEAKGIVQHESDEEPKGEANA